MIERKRILQAVCEAVDEMNETLSPGERLEKSEAAPLFGREGRLDSLGLVNLVVAVEEKIRDAFSAEISLTDERAMSYRSSPFRSLGAMTDYILHAMADARVEA
jgi:D-alanine--poly(phosphoribitol) ligase subunit 2